MTTLERLEQYAQDRGIIIIPGTVDGGTAVCARYRGKQIIMIDYARLQTDVERAYVLAHEITHLERETLSSKYTRFVPRGKLEHQTDTHLIEDMLPECILNAAIAAHGGRTWAVAEELDVSEMLVKKAIRYYKTREED